MSRATGTADGGAGTKRRDPARPATGKTGARGSDTDTDTAKPVDADEKQAGKSSAEPTEKPAAQAADKAAGTEPDAKAEAKTEAKAADAKTDAKAVAGKADPRAAVAKGEAGKTGDETVAMKKVAADKAGDKKSDADGAGSVDGGAGPAGRGKTVTETRGPQPYHPPKAYEPPAERSASGSTSGSASAAQPAQPAKAAADGKGAKGAKAAKNAGKAVPAARQAPDRAADRAEAPAARPAARTAPADVTAPRTRKARLRVAKADPWSVMKVSFLLSVALGVCTIVAATVLWLVMDTMGVFSAVGGTVSDATASGEGGGFDLESFLSLPHVLLFTSIIAVIDVVLATALATLGAFVYNLSAGFVGGVELTLAEDE